MWIVSNPAEGKRPAVLRHRFHNCVRLEKSHLSNPCQTGIAVYFGEKKNPNQLLHLLLFMNNNKKVWKKVYLICPPAERWTGFLFSLTPLCAPLVSAGAFRWVFFTHLLWWRPIYASRELWEGPSNEDGNYFMWSHPFWLTRVSRAPRLAGTVPGEDLALQKPSLHPGVSAERFLSFWILQKARYNQLYWTPQGGWCKTLMHTLFYWRWGFFPT